MRPRPPSGIVDRMEVVVSVSNALITREKLEAVRERLMEAVKAYQTAVEVSQQRYLAGKSGYFEVLEAQQQLVPAERWDLCWSA